MSASREAYKTGRDALTEDEVQRLLQHARTFEAHLLLSLAVSTGIRREDLVAVQLHDVDPETGSIGFWESKKRRPWRVVVGGETLRLLKRWEETLPNGTQYLFPGHGHGVKHVSGKTAWNVLDRTLKAAGLKPRPFHALRATCIKLAQKRGWTPEQVSELTGDTIRTIQTHYSTPSHDEMSEVARVKAIL